MKTFFNEQKLLELLELAKDFEQKMQELNDRGEKFNQKYKKLAVAASQIERERDRFYRIIGYVLNASKTVV